MHNGDNPGMGEGHIPGVWKEAYTQGVEGGIHPGGIYLCVTVPGWYIPVCDSTRVVYVGIPLCYQGGVCGYPSMLPGWVLNLRL